MSGVAWKFGMVALLTTLSVRAQMPRHSEIKLSKAESVVVARQLATLKTSGERNIAEDWSNAKKVAEIICRPAALIVLKKQDARIDKVFLGLGNPQSLTLESNQRLIGKGEYRTPKGWQDISFVCLLNPATGKVTTFQFTPAAAQ